MVLQRDAEGRLLIGSANLEALSADPSHIKDGDFWYVKTSPTNGKVKFAIGGAIVTIDQAGTVAVQ